MARSLSSGSADQKVKTWDVECGACVATSKLDGAVCAVAASADGPVPLLGVTDAAATLYCMDPRLSRGIVHSFKPGVYGTDEAMVILMMGSCWSKLCAGFCTQLVLHSTGNMNGVPSSAC